MKNAVKRAIRSRKKEAMKVTSNRFAGSVAPRRKPLRYGENRMASATTGTARASEALRVTLATPAAA